MTPENFCYWLQGLIEVGNPSELDQKQIQVIKDHLALVFKKETPIYNPPFQDGTSVPNPPFYPSDDKPYEITWGTY